MLDINGYEIPDPTPVELPTRLRLPVSRAEQIRAFIRQELSQSASAQGHESFEEAMDLEVEEDDTPLTRYEQMALEGDPSYFQPTTPPHDGSAADGGKTAPPAGAASEVKNEPQE